MNENKERSDSERVVTSNERDRIKKRSSVRRVRFPDGTYGVYMGETGGGNARRGLRKRRSPSNGAGPKAITHPDGAESGIQGENSRPASAYEGERLRRERFYREKRRREAERKKELEEQTPIERFVRFIHDKTYLKRMAISVDVECLVKGAVTGALILVFALLQTTVFSRFAPFGATPDLMLSLFIAISATEGEKWGSVSALIGGYLICALGSTGGEAILPLYVGVSIAVGLLGRYSYRDSVPVRAIYTVCACLIETVFTVILMLVTYDSVSAGVILSSVVIPEFFSTLLTAPITHVAAWLCMKPFNKSRAERVD